MAAFKDHFSIAEVANIGEAFKSNYAKFDSSAFVSEISRSDWESKELKARIEAIASGIFHHSGEHFEAISEALIGTSKEIEGFSVWPLQTVIELFGLESPELALETMAQITEKASAEFAIRPFLEHHKALSSKKVRDWAQHENHHIRRLASEGSRPKLPWGNNVSWITKNPNSFADVLDLLSDDQSDYVRKSVANHTNDITKLDKSSALVLTGKWMNGSENQQKVAKHALRWLLKKGDKEALAQVGFSGANDVEVQSFKASQKTVNIGDEVEFSNDLIVNSKNPLSLDIMMVMYYPGKSGERKTTFNWKRGEFTPGKSELRFKFKFEHRSIRILLPGKFRFVMTVNGEEKGEVRLDLE